MTIPPAGSATSMQMRRIFDARREKVWAAWTERAHLEEWMCKDVPGQEPRYVELDVRPGGRYVIEIPLTDGKYAGQGTFLEVRPPEKLVFTWSWRRIPPKAGEQLGGESLVTVELFDLGASTEMRFAHTNLETPEILESHRAGWTGCFEILTSLLEAPIR